MNILLVEDDEVLCDILAKMLKFEGINSIIANNGYEAEKILLDNHHDIHMILCDVMMPNMDGYEFLNRVKNISSCKDIPFIFTTARVSRDEELRGLMLGAKAYLKKPVDITTLLTTINDFQRE